MENLKKLRLQNKLTQKELAKLLNIDSTTYLGYEKNKFEPSISVLKKLSKIFNCSVDYLIENENDNAIYCFNDLQKKAVNILLSLPENYFYEFLGRLKTTADILKIDY